MTLTRAGSSRRSADLDAGYRVVAARFEQNQAVRPETVDGLLERLSSVSIGAHHSAGR